MTPSEIRRQTLKELRATRKDMASAAFLLTLQKKPENVQLDAARHSLDVQSAIRALENEQLSAIATELSANEAPLLKGISDLERARKSLAKVETIIKAAGSVLEILAKVFSFTATRGIV